VGLAGGRADRLDASLATTAPDRAVGGRGSHDGDKLAVRQHRARPPACARARYELSRGSAPRAGHRHAVVATEHRDRPDPTGMGSDVHSGCVEPLVRRSADCPAVAARPVNGLRSPTLDDALSSSINAYGIIVARSFDHLTIFRLIRRGSATLANRPAVIDRARAGLPPRNTALSVCGAK
jgi:hypothetical protein